MAAGLIATAALVGPAAARADLEQVADSSGIPAFHADPVPSFDSTEPPSTGQRVAPISGRLNAEAEAAAEAGISALGKNRFEQAEAAFIKLLKLSPDNVSGLINLGLVEFRLGRAEPAQRYFRRAIQVKPEAGLAWMMLGVTYMNQADEEGATAALAQAVYLNPKSPQAHNYLAVTMAKRGWYDAAEDELRKVLELSPGFAEAHFNLALIYFQENPPAVEMARRHYQKALELGAAPDRDFEAKLKAAPEATEVQ